MSDDMRGHQLREDMVEELRQWIESSRSSELREIIERARKVQEEMAEARRVDPESLKVPVTL